MLHLMLENEDTDTSIPVPQGPKLYAKILDKMGCSQVVVAIPNQSQNEWFSSLEPWRVKVKMSIQDTYSKKTRTSNFFSYVCPEYVEKVINLLLQHYYYTKAIAYGLGKKILAISVAQKFQGRKENFYAEL